MELFTLSGKTFALRQKTWIKALLTNFLPFAGLIAVVLFFQIYSNGRLLTPRNLQAILNEGFVILIGAIGLVFCIAQSNLDFSMGSIMGVSALLAAKASAINLWYAIPVALLTGIAIGLLNGFIHAKIGISSFIATLATRFMLSGVMLVLLAGVGSIAAPLQILSWDSKTLKFVVLIVTAAIASIVFELTRLGKYIKAIGSREEVARQSGINIKAVKVAGFVISGGIAGFLAFFSIVRTGTASATTGLNLELNALNALLLGGLPLTGGTGSKFRGVIIGAVTMTVLSNGMVMLGVDNYLQQLIRGVIFLIAVSLTFDRKNMSVIK